MTEYTKHDIINIEKFSKGEGEKMIWREMSYEVYTQTGQNTEPEVWDDIYEPSLEQWIEWIDYQSNQEERLKNKG